MSAGGELVCRLINEGELGVMYGAAYGSEVASASGWQPATGPMPFAAWGVILPSDQTCTFRARVPANLEPGRYHISKGVRRVEHDGSLMPGEVGSLPVCAEFDIVSADD